jgi:hypothetical protein
MIAALIALLVPTSSSADGMLIAWSPQDLEGMTEARWNAASGRFVEAILELNLKARTWPEAYEVALGANANKGSKRLLDGLVAQLSDATETKLAKTSRLIVWERITSGDVLFEGKGLQVDDDLFLVAGRANWVLRSILEKNLGVVRASSSRQELMELQGRWSKLVAGQVVAEMPEPFPSAKRGLEELRSPQAIEALIASLRPSPAKEQLTRRCLKTIYGLDALPSDPTSSARLCDPDTSSHMFLGQITDVAGEHPRDWWDAWWQKNRAKLAWNPQAARFVTGP